MNQIQAIKRINDAELESGTSSSWHDQYKDSAYVNVGGLPYNLTEGDVITIFSQYGEVVDINMPRDPQTGKPRGFAWLMYMDQRSTVLAVDNLNGAQVLGRNLRVDHVLDYKQLEKDHETGKMKERESQSLVAHPERFYKPPTGSDASDAESDDSHPSIDLDDPMRDYLIEQKRAAKKRRIESGGGGGGESKEERKRKKEEKRREKEARKAERGRKREKRAVEGKGRREDRRDERLWVEVGSSSRREDSREKRRDPSPRRGVDRRRELSPRRDDRARNRDYDRRRDDHDDSRRDDRDREYRRNRDDRDDRDDRRGGDRGERRSKDAFADLERWARG